MPTPSARLGIPNYTEADTPVDIPTAWLARSAVLDTLVPISSSDLASRPVSSSGTPGIIGRQAIVTGEQDSPRLDLDLGNSWITVGPPMKDGPPTVPGSRSLGSSAGQAAPGNDNRLFSPGDLKMSAAANPSPGWLLCDGSAVSRSTFTDLFAAISTAYGAGDGSTTFNLPDYRGRTIVGAGTGPGLTARALGGKAGEENHTLSNGEMPVHSHAGVTAGDSPDHSHYTSGTTGADSPDHAHNSPGGYLFVTSTSGVAIGHMDNTGGYGTILGNGPYQATNPTTTGATARHAHSFGGQSGGCNTRHTHGVYNDGGGATHNNMQPFSVANVFIKT
jgi:microcystin-dependent protein